MRTRGTCKAPTTRDRINKSLVGRRRVHIDLEAAERMASPTKGFLDQHRGWSLQRRVHVRTPFSVIDRQHPAGQKTFDSYAYRRGGIVFDSPGTTMPHRGFPSTPSARDPITALASRQGQRTPGWPTPDSTSSRSVNSLPRRSPERYGGAAGTTLTVDVQSGALDRRTGLSSPNWFGMVGPHNDDYGPSYHSRRYAERPVATASDLIGAAGMRPRSIGYAAFASPSPVPRYRMPSERPF